MKKDEEGKDSNENRTIKKYIATYYFDKVIFTSIPIPKKATPTKFAFLRR